MTVDALWLGLGFAGQALFAGRFLLQWLRSEQEGRSVIPLGFWWLSIAGSMILFAYALHLRDPVFALGQSTGVLIYARNLHLIHKAERAT